MCLWRYGGFSFISYLVEPTYEWKNPVLVNPKSCCTERRTTKVSKRLYYDCCLSQCWQPLVMMVYGVHYIPPYAWLDIHPSQVQLIMFEYWVQCLNRCPSVQFADHLVLYPWTDLPSQRNGSETNRTFRSCERKLTIGRRHRNCSPLSRLLLLLYIRSGFSRLTYCDCHF